MNLCCSWSSSCLASRRAQSRLLSVAGWRARVSLRAIHTAVYAPLAVRLLVYQYLPDALEVIASSAITHTPRLAVYLTFSTANPLATFTRPTRIIICAEFFALCPYPRSLTDDIERSSSWAPVEQHAF
ncbi:hypothetical protein GY45DRAFT_335540 [Cubamyces sp. BRFM 1775]|nr:hypothetical protein GY45DRAFT_335540 [Cubamyces sp. BRFM 1775]